MGQGFMVPVAADTSQAVKAVHNLGEAFDRIADNLDGVADESGRTERDLLGDLRNLGNRTEATAESLHRDFRAAFDKVRTDSERTARAVADDARHHVQDRGGDYIGEFKDEARQNFSEVASSFSGGIDGAADLVQGTLGGLAASLPGPVGIASGLLAGIGGAMWASFDDNAAKSEQRISDMFDDMMQSGLSYLSDQAVIDGINAIYQGTDDAAISLDTARGYAEDLGLAVEDVVAAFAGSRTAQDEVNAAIQAGKEQAEALLATSNETVDTYTDQVLAATDQYDAMEDVANALGRVNGELESAQALTEGARKAAETWTATGAKAAQDRAREAESARQVSERYRELEGLTFYPSVDPAALAQAEAQLANLARRRETVIVGVARDGQAVV